MLATVWSPTWVIDGRDPARTPQPHKSETRKRKRSTAWACRLFPRSGMGGAWLFAMPRYRAAPVAKRIGQCAKPGKPTGDRRLSHGVLMSQNGGSYVTGTWNRIHFVHRTG